MRKSSIIIFLFVLGVFVMQIQIAQAGFGISPPFVKTKKPIFPGSHFEQIVTLLRSDTEDDLMARIKIDAPELADWVSVKQGLEFDLPENQLQVPMRIIVDVPNDAEIGNYQGYLNIQILPKKRSLDGGVAIALGARVDIDLEITDEPFVDFSIRNISIPDLHKFKSPWDWKLFSYLFYRLNVVMRIENTGNVPVSPSRVHVDVFDLNEKELLETYDDEKFDKVEPFATSEITADFSSNLGLGEYWAKIRVYQDNEIIHKDKIIFAVKPPDSANGGRPEGPWPFIVMGFLILSGIIAIILLAWLKVWRLLFWLYRFISAPFRLLLKVLQKYYENIKAAFWRYLHKKSSKYQDTNNVEIADLADVEEDELNDNNYDVHEKKEEGKDRQEE
ncbi:MAG: hypothetical protein U9Q85_02195 [Patescibacteria group bacterium]|nr:hypothetical protein [Patescibacteria group bacterium]